MSEVEQLSGDETVWLLRQAYGSPGQLAAVVAQVNGWLARGDGLAVYVNRDFGSAALGDIRLLSFGSADALIESEAVPQTMPDVGSLVSWQYQLRGTYRGGRLSC